MRNFLAASGFALAFVLFGGSIEAASLKDEAHWSDVDKKVSSSLESANNMLKQSCGITISSAAFDKASVANISEVFRKLSWGTCASAPANALQQLCGKYGKDKIGPKAQQGLKAIQCVYQPKGINLKLENGTLTYGSSFTVGGEENKIREFLLEKL